MRRRTLLTVGLATGTLLAVAGGTLALLGAPRREGRLTEDVRVMFAALAPAVLGSLVPEDAAARRVALQAHVDRVEQAIAGLPPALQAEVDELLMIAVSAPGRLAFVGLRQPWGLATVLQLRDALDGMRFSSLTLRQQGFHALRDLTNASWFSDDSTWVDIGYPGQMVV